MHYTTLGNTGLKVSVAGLGCGGNSRLGQGSGATRAESVAVVRTAFDLGVNLLDTAEVYGTEEIVGEAIASIPRDQVVISTKCRIRNGDTLRTGAEVVAALDQSLRRMNLDHVDVFHLHAVAPAAYDHALNELAPALLREKAKGKFAHLGITETGPNDPKQEMLTKAIGEAPWEVVMLALHMMNQNARRAILPTAKARGVGTLLMFVVRNIFSRPAALKEAVDGLVASGQIPKADAEPLAFLLREGGARDLTDAAHRFARHEAGVDVVLFGTGKQAHVRSNVESILGPRLPDADLKRLYDTFGHLIGVGLDMPDAMKAAAKK